MRLFEDHILESFDHATGWYRDNGYEGLNRTADELMQFRLPTGLNLSLSALATPNFSTSYHLGAGGRFDGSICYLYSSVPLTDVVSSSEAIPLPTLLRSYRQLQDLPPASSSPDHGATTTTTAAAPLPLVIRDRVQDFLRQPWLVFGRMFLPASMLEAQVIKRVSPATRLQLRGVSQADLPGGGTVLGSLQHNTPRYSVATLASTDGGLLGLRGLYNFGGDASSAAAAAAAPPAADEGDRIYGRWSAGGEIYYGVFNKSAGASVAARFATLPAHRGTPLTATLTLAPLMGNISASFAVAARGSCSLATRFDFNFYSYESDWAVGMELWGKGRMAGLIDAAQDDEVQAPSPPPPPPPPQPAVEPKTPPGLRGRSFQAKLEWRLDDDEADGGKDGGDAQPEKGQEIGQQVKEEEFTGVLKARMDQHFKVGLLWEGRLKALIFGLGTSINLGKPEQSFRSLGLEIQYSS